MSAHTCDGRAWAQGAMNSHRCRAKAKVERNGKHYCGRHDPVAVEAKRAARNEDWDRQFEERQEALRAARAAEAEQKRRADCYPDLLEALEWVMDRLVDKHETDESAVFARAAIAKATGSAQ